MSRYYGAAVALVLLVVFSGVVRADDEKDKVKDNKEYYPVTWTQVEVKPIIDNDRLFKKYKDCFIADKPVGCPRNVVEMRKILPEAMETVCGKCLPEHIARIKEVAEHVCRTRPDDYEEVKKLKDPNGELERKFTEKFGKVNC